MMRKTMKCLIGTVFTIIIISNMQFSYAQLHLCDNPFVDEFAAKWLAEVRICFEDEDKIFELGQNVTIHMYAKTTEPAEWIRIHFFHSSQIGFFEQDGAERQLVKESRIKESPHIINLQHDERVFGTDLEDATHFTISCNDPPCKKPYEQERVFQFSFPGTYYYEITMQTPNAENIYSYYPEIEVFKVLNYDEQLEMQANEAILSKESEKNIIVDELSSEEKFVEDIVFYGSIASIIGVPSGIALAIILHFRKPTKQKLGRSENITKEKEKEHLMYKENLLRHFAHFLFLIKTISDNYKQIKKETQNKNFQKIPTHENSIKLNRDFAERRLEEFRAANTSYDIPSTVRNDVSKILSDYDSFLHSTISGFMTADNSKTLAEEFASNVQTLLNQDFFRKNNQIIEGYLQKINKILEQSRTQESSSKQIPKSKSISEVIPDGPIPMTTTFQELGNGINVGTFKTEMKDGCATLTISNIVNNSVFDVKDIKGVMTFFDENDNEMSTISNIIPLMKANARDGVLIFQCKVKGIPVLANGGFVSGKIVDPSSHD